MTMSARCFSSQTTRTHSPMGGLRYCAHQGEGLTPAARRDNGCDDLLRPTYILQNTSQGMHGFWQWRWAMVRAHIKPETLR